jgi:hypothetical protein
MRALLRRWWFWAGVLSSTIAVVVVGIQIAEESREPAEPLTPARAKQALAEMMRSQQAAGWFKGDFPEKMAQLPIEEREDGFYYWTVAFSFNPSKKVYTYHAVPAPGVRACMFEDRGTFAWRNGRWIASPPELVRAALQSGK